MSNKDKILFVGDVHGRFDLLRSLISTVDPLAVVVAGDFGFWNSKMLNPHNNDNLYAHQYFSFDIPVYFVDGNHEDHNRLQQLVEKHGNKNPIDVGSNCWYIPRACTFDITNHSNGRKKTIVGLGGAYSIDKLMRIAGVTWFEQEQLRLKDIVGLDTTAPIDIVVSHTCPEVILPRVAKTCNIPYNNITERQTERLLDQVFDQISPKHWIFGHWHSSGSYRHRSTTLTLLNMINGANSTKLIKV